MSDKPVVTNLMLARAFWKNLHRPDGCWYSVRLWEGGEDGNCTSKECAYVSEFDETLGCPVGQAIMDAGLMTDAIHYYIGEVHELVADGNCPHFTFENIVFAADIQTIHDSSGGTNRERVIAKLLYLFEQHGIRPEELEVHGQQ